ncbi:ferredoxin [Adlercreutzia sp. ZJ138]|uniref:ferredoxin n=1 Tax=Adlercreutzia sp. ZJ138 TaxID=2709405 RepID=UPI0013EAD7AD|nr:ferredoxin [Adlercreutzia sp. ZJ138]
MIANYGYEDGAGQYFISIDTDLCVVCEKKPCVEVCEHGVYSIEEDDWDDEVVVVVESKKLSLSDLCAACKHEKKEACLAACPAGALVHSW